MNKVIISHIRSKLDAVAQQENIRILMAIESGSRAWGFPSTDSDYDIRFIYARPAQSYLSVEPVRDVIETPVVKDLVLDTVSDMNGWDIRKALQLVLKQNAVVNEWATSPVIYQEESSFVADLRELIDKSFQAEAFLYHYTSLARNAWDKIEQGDDTARLKDYCYALRAALSVRFIEQHGKVPPMNINCLMKQIYIDPLLSSAISLLISDKLNSTEAGRMNRSPVFDHLIHDIVSVKRIKDKTINPENKASLIKMANTILQQHIC